MLSHRLGETQSSRHVVAIVSQRGLSSSRANTSRRLSAVNSGSSTHITHASRPTARVGSARLACTAGTTPAGMRLPPGAPDHPANQRRVDGGALERRPDLVGKDLCPPGVG